jgi:hypothetical protein
MLKWFYGDTKLYTKCKLITNKLIVVEAEEMLVFGHNDSWGVVASMLDSDQSIQHLFEKDPKLGPQ